MLAWEARAGVFFLAKKRSKSSFRLFGRLGQGRDWGSGLGLESLVRDSSQQSYRSVRGRAVGDRLGAEASVPVTASRRRLACRRFPYCQPAAKSVPVSTEVTYPGCEVQRSAEALPTLEPRTFGVPLCPLQRDNDHGPRPVPHQGDNLEIPTKVPTLRFPRRAGGLSVGTPVLLLAWEARAGIYF